MHREVNALRLPNCHFAARVIGLRIMSFSVILPVLLGVVFFIAVLRATIYRPKYTRIDDVISFGRKLTVAELEAVMDPGLEWELRNLVPPSEFRVCQRERIRLVREYLQRVAHNAEVIQLWAMNVYETIKDKSKESFTAEDYLVEAVVELSTELRIYGVVALLKISPWIIFRLHLLPLRWIPRVSDLRMIGSTNVISKYTELIEATSVLAGRMYGAAYQNQITAAF